MSALESYILPGDAVFPEGIVVRADEFFASSFTQGTIYRGRLDRASAEVFLAGGTDGRTSALGLALDRRGHLFVCGGATGLAFVYDADSGKLIRRFDNGLAKTIDPMQPKAFLNDVTTLPSGDAFLTDSIVPMLYRIPAEAVAGAGLDAPQGDGRLEPWLSFADTPLRYQFGNDVIASLNLNGIASTADGRYLIVVQTNTGRLFRIDVASKRVDTIGGVDAPGGDGLVLEGQTLYVIHVDPVPILRFRLGADFLSGEPDPLPRQPSLKAPTTAAFARGRLLVVNSQFDKLFYGGRSEPPFEVSSVDVGAA